MGRRRKEKNLKTTGPIAIVECARECVIVIYAYPGGPSGIYKGKEEQDDGYVVVVLEFIAIQNEEYLKKKM